MTIESGPHGGNEKEGKGIQKVSWRDHSEETISPRSEGEKKKRT